MSTIALPPPQQDGGVGSGKRHHGVAMRRQCLQRGVRIIFADRIMHGGRLVQLHGLGVMISCCLMMPGGLLLLIHGVLSII